MKREIAAARRGLIRGIILEVRAKAATYRTVETWADIVYRHWDKDKDAAPHPSTVKRVLNQMVNAGELHYKQTGRGWFHQDRFK